MEDLKKLDSLTEFKLTNAIQKAASKALTSENDRSEILAGQLAADGIPKQLTKLATQAFNRRISVITIGQRKEDTKADDFPLADFNKVASLRGCDTEIKKSASVNSNFILKVEKAPEMRKVASFKPLERPVKQISPSEALQNLDSCMHKEEAAFQNQMNEFLEEQKYLQRMVKKASEMLSKDIKTAKLLATVYGNTYQELFTDKVPEEALKKHAAYAILPANATVEYVENTIKQADRVSVKRDLLMLKKASLERFVKEAVQVEEKLKRAMLQKTAGAGYNMVKDIAANAISVPVNAALGFGRGLAEQTGEIANTASPFLSTEKGYSPSDVIDLSLLQKDRYQDKRMRLIDMLASPEMAQYPAREIEKAVEDVIATNQDLASPRMREYLKAEVNARLLAGNRANRADLAAAADIAKKVNQAEKNRQAALPEAAVEGLAEKRTEGKSITDTMPSIDKAVARISNKELPVKDLGQSWKALLTQIADDRKFREDLNEKINAENSKALEGYAKRRSNVIANLMRTAQAEKEFKASGKVPVDPKTHKPLDRKDWSPALMNEFRQFQEAYYQNKPEDVKAGLLQTYGKV